MPFILKKSNPFPLVGSVVQVTLLTLLSVSYWQHYIHVLERDLETQNLSVHIIQSQHRAGCVSPEHLF